MTFFLDEDESFSLTAYAQSPGYQSAVLQGYLVSRRSDGTYVAPLVPALFYGADGQPLNHSWRQYIPTAGSQIILSRSGGQPKVPREELAWKKVSTRVESKASQPIATAQTQKLQTGTLTVTLLTAGAIILLALLFRKKKRG